jgi:FixJ family two-component response regulator
MAVAGWAKLKPTSTLRHRRPERRIVFLDAKLPDMDGLDVARFASCLEGVRPKVFLVSGYHYSDDPVIRQAIEEGIICGFLAKPFSNQDIRGCLSV